MLRADAGTDGVWVAAFTAEVRRLTSRHRSFTPPRTGGAPAPGTPRRSALTRSGWPRGRTAPRCPPAGNWTYWQYSSRASVPGISGNVDVSYFLRAALHLLDPGGQRFGANTLLSRMCGRQFRDANDGYRGVK